MPEASDDLAKEALVFLVVGLTGHWKHPIAYVLQDKCPASVQAKLMECMNLLHEEDITVKAVVFDGTFTNQAIAVKLGGKMKVSGMKSWFPHPQLKNLNVYVIFDAHHMITLMRNLLGTYKVICHEVNGECQMIR